MRCSLLVLIALGGAFAGCSGCEGQKERQAAPPEQVIDARTDAGNETRDNTRADAQPAPEPEGRIEGTIYFDGALPRMPPLKRTSDPACVQMPKTEESVLVKDGKLQNVFVRITQNVSFGKKLTDPVTLDQRSCAYHPRVLGAAFGQPLRVLNSDATLHNVRATQGDANAFNLVQDANAAPIERQLTAGVTKFHCDIHPWMNAFVIVSPHKYFAVSGEDGRFEIAGLPDGDYTLETWHERYKPKLAPVTVKDGRAQVEFRFSEADRQQTALSR